MARSSASFPSTTSDPLRRRSSWARSIADADVERALLIVVTERQPSVRARLSHFTCYVILRLGALTCSFSHPMRALSVARRRALRPAPALSSVSSASFSTSTLNNYPRSLPHDFSRRAAPFAQAAVDDAHVSPGSARVEVDDVQGTPDTGKPRKRSGRPSGSPNKPPSSSPPTVRAAVGPEAIWSGRALGGDEARALPPDDMLQDALSQLLVTLQPQTQYRAAYTTNGAPLVEPTMAIYCPIEGSDVSNSIMISCSAKLGVLGSMS